MFIAVDGIDGAGKTTLVQQLAAALIEFSPIITKEPTNDSLWGMKLRSAAYDGRLSPDQELEYYRKDRQDHIEKLIKPALKSNRVVITDRYADSTLAFQTKTPAEADELYDKLLPETLVPDISFILKCPVEIGLSRVIARDGEANISVFEKPEILKIAKEIFESRRGENYAFLDSSQDKDYTFSQAIKVLIARFPEIENALQLD